MEDLSLQSVDEIYNEFNHNVTSYEKELLLMAINSYIEKINFVVDSNNYYFVDSSVIKSFKRDRDVLYMLQKKFFTIEIIEDYE